MTTEHARRGALESIDRILNRGGTAEDVRRDVVAVLAPLYPYVAISLRGSKDVASTPPAGAVATPAERRPITFRGITVGELAVAGAQPDDGAFLDRVALLVSPYCSVSQPAASRRTDR